MIVTLYLRSVMPSVRLTLLVFMTAGEALRLIDRSSVDSDSRARMSIHPITEILTLPVTEPQTKLTVAA